MSKRIYELIALFIKPGILVDVFPRPVISPAGSVHSPKSLVRKHKAVVNVPHEPAIFHLVEVSRQTGIIDHYAF